MILFCQGREALHEPRPSKPGEAWLGGFAPAWIGPVPLDASRRCQRRLRAGMALSGQSSKAITGDRGFAPGGLNGRGSRRGCPSSAAKGVLGNRRPPPWRQDLPWAIWRLRAWIAQPLNPCALDDRQRPWNPHGGFWHGYFHLGLRGLCALAFRWARPKPETKRVGAWAGRFARGPLRLAAGAIAMAALGPAWPSNARIVGDSGFSPGVLDGRCSRQDGG